MVLSISFFFFVFCLYSAFFGCLVALKLGEIEEQIKNKGYVNMLCAVKRHK